VVRIYLYPNLDAVWIGPPLLVTRFKLILGSLSNFYIIDVDFRSIASWMGNHPSLVDLFTSTSDASRISRISLALQKIA
jgi:hypothetical protein